MGNGDRLAIESALDAAEAQIEANNAAQEEVIQESPSTPADGQSDKIVEAEEVKQFARTREAQGKSNKQEPPAQKKKHWAPRSTSQASAEESTDNQQNSSQGANQAPQTFGNQGNQNTGPTSESVKLPDYWPAELRSIAGKAPRDVVEQFARYDANRTQGVQRLLNESRVAKETYNRLHEGWDERKDIAALNGVHSPVDELQRYRAWDAVFNKDPELAIVDLIRKNNLQNRFQYNGSVRQEPEPPPWVQQIIDDNKQLKEKVSSFENSSRQQVDSAIQSEYQAFQSGKDSRGESRAKNLQLFEPQIAWAIGELKKVQPNMSRVDLLNHAYEFTMQQVREGLGVQNGSSVAAPNQSAAAPSQSAIQSAKKAQQAAGSVRGAPASVVSSGKVPLKGRNFNEKLDSAIDRAIERLG